ncbi:MAG: signal peptidase I [Candidatus Aenigmarchaeota archaeon]|nr:signal peptidase I [Candidatus Aenigmarchaeota archaeon]
MDNRAKGFIFIFFIIGFILLSVYWQNISDIHKNIIERQDYNCITKTEEKTVRGTSLTGLIENGQNVNILFDYYNCNEIKKWDVVVYDYAGNDNLIIKIVKGLPGDKFSLEKTERGWNILINNEIVKNSKNQSYLLNQKSYQMLSLYERDYKGIIPETTYLILGNLAKGSLDSTKFGLVGKGDITGKVEFN